MSTPPLSPRKRPPSHGRSSSTSASLAWQSPPPSPGAVFARLKRRPQKNALVFLLCVALGVFLLGSVTVSETGGSGVVYKGMGVQHWRWVPPSWRVRRKASEGWIKEGGRVSKNESYTTNLLPDVHYLTSFHISGLNNQILVQFNLLHLAFLLHTSPTTTPHTPILPPFFPHFHHLLKTTAAPGEERAAPVLRFSQVFDLDRLAEEVGGMGIVEWSELKEGWTGVDTDGGYVEEEWVDEPERKRLAKERKEKGEKTRKMAEGEDPEVMGCWSSWMNTNNGGDLGMRAAALYYNIRPSLTPLPPSLFSPANRSPAHQLLPSTAHFLSPPNNRLQTDYLSLITPEAETLVASWGKNQSVSDVWGETKAGWVRPEGSKPGEVTCFDMLYFASEHGEEVRESFEGAGGKDAGPWATIGRHAHWNPGLKRISIDIMRQTLGLPPGLLVPDVLTLHIRRTDLLDACPAYAAPCFAPSHFLAHLSSLRARLGPQASSWPVLVTTDEVDPAYLAELASLGWIVMDHKELGTKEEYGVWYPALVDNVVLSLGRGFVGTGGSTMSILAARRVQDWNGGETEMVRLLESVE